MPVLARNPKHPTAGWGDGGGSSWKLPQAQKILALLCTFSPNWKDHIFTTVYTLGSSGAPFKGHRLGGEGSSISCAFPKVNLLGRGATLESQGWVGGRRASFRAAQAGAAPAGRLFPGGAAGCCFLDV